MAPRRDPDPHEANIPEPRCDCPEPATCPDPDARDDAEAEPEARDRLRAAFGLETVEAVIEDPVHPWSIESNGVRIENRPTELTIVQVHGLYLIDTFKGSETFGTARILFSGTGFGRDQDSYRVDARKLEFCVEIDDLMIYEQTVRWCDNRAIWEMWRTSGCKRRPRTLRRIARIRLHP